MESRIDSSQTSDSFMDVATEPLTPLELHVFLLLWQGIPRYQIAKEVGRSRRQLTRIVKSITKKLPRFDVSLILYRLETELFMRVSTMTTPELLKALAIYHRRTSTRQETSRATRQADVNMGLKQLMQALFQENGKSPESFESKF
jgi:DNA-binding CsgD family transcriptional regulator